MDRTGTKDFWGELATALSSNQGLWKEMVDELDAMIGNEEEALNFLSRQALFDESFRAKALHQNGRLSMLVEIRDRAENYLDRE